MARFKPSRHPMRTFLIVIYTAFLLGTTVNVVMYTSGGETTGREAAAVAVVGVLTLAVIGAAMWWVRRALDRQSREFLARLDAPAVRRRP